MTLLDRFKAAWLSFRDPATYWEGVSIRNISREIALKDGIAVIRPDQQTEYTVHMLPYSDQSAIRRYLGW